MVSSQMEMASSPYVRILKDHNRLRDRESNSQSQSAFQKNFKELVKDHLHTCIDENSQFQFDNEEISRHNFRSVSRKETRFESPAVKRRQSRILDRWAARQAQEMLTTIERNAHEAELLALSNSQTVSTRASTLLRESSPAQSDSSIDHPNLQASSLVQKWKEFEVEAKIARGNQSGKANTDFKSVSSSSSSSIRINSTINNIEIASVCDSNDERYEDSITDWESQRTDPCESLSSSQGKILDIAESERVRVADIIRRLTSFSRIQCSIISSSDEIDKEQRDLPFIGNPPRIRGRQAIVDLLLRMKRERQRELSRLEDRHVVSRFSQRGRIQSLLRLRLLQHKVADQDQRHPSSRTSELDQLPQRNTIFLLRQTFSPQIKRGASRAVLSREDNVRSHTELPNKTQDSQHSVRSDELTIQDVHQQMVASFEHNRSVPSAVEYLQDEANVSWQGPLDTATTSNGWDGDAITEESGLDTRQHDGSIDDWEGGDIVTEELDANTLHLLEHADETWLSDVSPPQRDGEDSRQAWYHDMLENNSYNEEIRELLERRSVSNFLVSSFRERMERLVSSYLQRQRHRAIVENVEEGEEDKPNKFRYREISDDSDQVASTSLQLPLPSLLRSWNQYEDHESDDSDRVASTSLQLPQPSQSYFQDTRQCSPFINHPSLEMELIYDLRGHMERLHHEMSELRKSIENCMGMQVKLQKSIKQEVATAVSHSIRGEKETEIFNRVPMRKGNCCICYDMQINSLLYRCGHMCTCFKCAYELQWSSGRCPICQDPIVDVVRTYSDS